MHLKGNFLENLICFLKLNPVTFGIHSYASIHFLAACVSIAMSLYFYEEHLSNMVLFKIFDDIPLSLL